MDDFLRSRLEYLFHNTQVDHFALIVLDRGRTSQGRAVHGHDIHYDAVDGGDRLEHD